MPRWILQLTAILIAISLFPLAYIARSRVTLSDQPRIQIVYDMDSQPKYKAQTANPIFSDQRAMRPPVEGTVARGELHDDEFLYKGKVGGKWADRLPMPLTEATMKRGRDRFGIYCSPCHGLDGRGDGLVARRADRLAEGTWTPPSDLSSELVVQRKDGEIFDIISHGIRKMPAYGPQIPVRDRWAIVAYLRALQRSAHGTLADVPQDQRAALGIDLPQDQRDALGQ